MSTTTNFKGSKFLKGWILCTSGKDELFYKTTIKQLNKRLGRIRPYFIKVTTVEGANDGFEIDIQFINNALDNNFTRYRTLVELQSIRHVLYGLIEAGMVLTKSTWKSRKPLKDWKAKCQIDDIITDIEHSIKDIDKR